jgi:CRISPR-associated Csx11 family protein
MSNGSAMIATLRTHRPLLLACEAIGWLHMTGKAHPDFLRSHGGTGVQYDDLRWHQDQSPPFDWSNKLAWVKNTCNKLAWVKNTSGNIPKDKWPSSLADFLTKHRQRDDGMLGLLQAAHAMASGIEKNIPTATSEYLKQDVTHMWLASPFGHPVRNLLADPPALLQPGGWERLLQQIEGLLGELRELGSIPCNDPAHWWHWRERAIGPSGWLREAFLSTLAETRLPNNDVTLWDQSYVAAALFKSAVAGAVLAGTGFMWDNNLKQETRWRVLTVSFGTRHYEARAVRIGDWMGAQRDIKRFFQCVRSLIEVEVAVGSLVYQDDEILAFTFPGQRGDGGGGLDDARAEELRKRIERKVSAIARKLRLETPPLCQLSASTRSFVPMVQELRKARESLAVPVHRSWTIPPGGQSSSSGACHVCPVCLVRLNEPPKNAQTDNARKSAVCAVCRERRRGRLDAWLAGDGETIWISEVADHNDRVALLSLSLGIEPWLDGSHVDSLRAQAIDQWKRHNAKVSRSIENQCKPRAGSHLQNVLQMYLKKRISNPPLAVHTDGVLRRILPGLEEEFSSQNHGNISSNPGRVGFEQIFRRLVEDRAGSVAWSSDSTENAKWFIFQSFRKLPSPGRIYRFWRASEAFFDELLERFREIAAAHPNRWRTRRLALVPDNASLSAGWEDRETYAGRWREGPFEIVYLEERKAFLTIVNLARCLEAVEAEKALVGKTIELKGDDGQLKSLTVKSVRTPENLGVYAPVIPLDRSPQRFRVLVPLDRATACIEAALARWLEEFGRVWDRMPLRVSIVAFPRMTPFQAVIEATRNLEDALDRDGQETWRVEECRTRNGITGVSLKRKDGATELVLVPTTLPDGREDVFYPYVRVEDRQLRYPRDFQHPESQVFRHVADLRRGDGLRVDASRIATVFLDTTARRFEPVAIRALGDFDRMRAIWELLVRHAPSLTALRGAWAEIVERSRTWRDPDGRWLPGGKEQWLALARAILQDRLGLSGAALEALVDAAGTGTFEWALEWHLTWLKEGFEERRK